MAGEPDWSGYWAEAARLNESVRRAEEHAMLVSTDPPPGGRNTQPGAIGDQGVAASVDGDAMAEAAHGGKAAQTAAAEG